MPHTACPAQVIEAATEFLSTFKGAVDSAGAIGAKNSLEAMLCKEIPAAKEGKVLMMETLLFKALGDSDVKRAAGVVQKQLTFCTSSQATLLSLEEGDLQPCFLKASKSLLGKP